LGTNGKKQVDIPFSDITAINLVGYKNTKLSRMHFGTKSIYKIKKISFIDAESRPHITFENIKDGEKVFELLNLLWSRNRNILKLKVIQSA
jgi:hypothetical protein